jgi:hypothetical protein
MKYSGKSVLIFLIMLMLAAHVFAVDFKALQTDVDGFAKDMSKALPFYSSIGLNWSDAYIGGFPHFGMGLSAGLTTMKSESINNMLALFGIPVINLPLLDKKFPLPAYSIDARIGLPIIPLDFGVKFGYLSESWLESLLGIGIKSMLIGADVRYVIINSKVLPLRFSVGLGFNYLNGGISKKFETLSFTNAVISVAGKPQLDIIWKTTNIELKTQVSFPFRIVTPYAGAGISYSWSQAGYKISSPTSITVSNPGALGITDVSDKSFETIKKFSGINTRVFGGISFNLAYIRLDLTGMYEITNGNFGATIGFRFQM